MTESSDAKLFDAFLAAVPKCELHIHIEGSMEPELMFELAKRNSIKLSGDVASAKAKRENFKDLQDFLDLYYAGCSVLLTEADFHDLCLAYLRRAAADGVAYAEIFFDPQSHTSRGVSFDTVVKGLHSAIVLAREKLGIAARLIMCFLRHLSEKEAFEALEQAAPHLDKIVAVGLDSGEQGNPPSKFQRVYAAAAKMGLLAVAHGGEEGGPEYVLEALDLLRVRRVDHGVRCLESAACVERLVREQIPLTCCPCSNHRLQVYRRFFKGENVLGKMLSMGLKVTINSDDPAYFGGFMLDNFRITARECQLSAHQVLQICRNSFEATFAPEKEKLHYLAELDKCKAKFAPLFAVGWSREPWTETGGDRAQDAGNVLHLEHLNLEAPQQAAQAAALFYQDALGATRDPFRKGPASTAWLNIGRQQIHMPLKGSSAQVVGGTVGLIVPQGHIATVRKTLDDLKAKELNEFKGCGVLPSDNLVLGERAAAAAAESKSAAVESKSTAADAGAVGAAAAEGESKLRATDNLPIRRPGSESERVAALLAKYAGSSSSSATTADDSLLVACPWGNRFRLHTMRDAFPFPGGFGIAYVHVACAPGTAAAIAGFYREIVRASVTVVAAGTVAIVGMGPGQELVFVETAAGTVPKYDGHHLAIYIADFSGVFRRLEERKLIFVSGVHADKSQSLSDALKERQFRFKDIVSLETGAVVHSLEHEVRSIHHPSFMRPLVNRLGTGIQ